MQSIFRLPWCNEHLGPKMSDKATSLEPLRPTPLVELPMLNKLKRKRTDSPEPATSASRPLSAKKQRADAALPSPLPSPLPAAPPPAKPAAKQTPVPVTSPASDTTSPPSAPASRPDLTRSLQIPSRNEILPQQASLQRKIFIATAQGSSESMDRGHNTIDLDIGGGSGSSKTTAMSKVQEAIENQFNMQILLKHNELRLIEQELAKCQVALEQLRRCELKPYPGSSQPSEYVSAGTGPSITPGPGFTRPLHPAPYGVTDGPYTRHYQDWLVHDPQFDSIPEQALAHLEGGANAAGRPTRNSGSARKSVSKIAPFTSRPTEPLQSISNYQVAQARDKSAPLVLKRSTDGQLVKLICNNCSRGNFSSIQGFLNHCRIAHRVEYKSHDEAAIKCGQLLDEGEMANLPPTTVSTPAPKPAQTRSSTAASTPCGNPVRPFNTTAGNLTSAFTAQPPPVPARAPVPALNTAALSPSTATSAFTPSATVPHLSAYFEKHQLGGDLAKAVTKAKRETPFGLDGEVSSADESDMASPLDSAMAARSMASGNRTGGSAERQGRPPSRKGFRQPTGQRPRPSPLMPTTSGDDTTSNQITGRDNVSSLVQSPQNLTPTTNMSPHTAADSNPGLVSDHDDEEDGAGSASEEESPRHTSTFARHHHHPPLSSGAVANGRTCSSHDPMEIVVEDAHEIDGSAGGDGVFIRRNSLNGDDVRALQAAAAAAANAGMGARPASRK